MHVEKFAMAADARLLEDRWSGRFFFYKKDEDQNEGRENYQREKCSDEVDYSFEKGV